MITEKMYAAVSKNLDGITTILLKFAEEIREYESDTFSAESSKITEAESAYVATRFLLHGLEAQREHVDGLAISHALSAIREAADEKAGRCVICKKLGQKMNEANPAICDACVNDLPF